MKSNHNRVVALPAFLFVASLTMLFSLEACGRQGLDWQTSLAQAMAALAKRSSLATFETRGRTYIIAALLILPLVWSFAGLWAQTSYCSLLISLDVYVLAICIFWNIREAFLPPVTMEELDALRGTPNKTSSELTSENASNKSPVKRAAGTRGWYDNASETVNFVVPAFVALMFVAIEMIVLMTVSLK